MTTSDLLACLNGDVSDQDWRRLEASDPGLVISRWNRQTLLRMRGFQPDGADVDDRRVEAMERTLSRFLDRHMADQPEGHRWILLSCLFLAFIAREPLHPGEIVHHRPSMEGGRVVHRCPAREDAPDSLCRFCVCQSAREEA